MEKIKEIEIHGEGIQLKYLLEENYSYKELLNRFGLKRNSINRYVGGVLITNKKFIKQIEELYQKPFHEIVNPVENQMRRYLHEIKNNIKHYNKPNDNKLILDQYDNAMIYSNPYDQLIAKGNLALYKYNMGLHYEAELALKQIIHDSEVNEYLEHEVYYTVQVAFIQLGYDIKECSKTLHKVKIAIEEKNKDGVLSKEAIFNYYHFYGVVLKRNRKYKEAREIFKVAIEWATDPTRLARAISNIGVTYFEEGKYKSSIEWEHKALDKSPPDVETRSIILNNIALSHHKKGEIGKAHYYIKLAMENIDEDFEIGAKIGIYDTFFELNAKEGDRLLKVIVDILNQTAVINEYQEHLVTLVEKIFNLLKANRDTENVLLLKNLLLSYTRSEGAKRYLGGLKILAIDMIHYLEDEGVKVFAEGTKAT